MSALRSGDPSSHSTYSSPLSSIIIVLIAIDIQITVGQCPAGTTMSFEKISSVTVRGVPLYPLFSGPADTPVTAECNNRCRAGPKCRAFLLNYDKSACTGMDYESLATSRGASVVSTAERTAYFEKICLSSAPCEKAWTFERVMGRELQGFDDRVLNGVASRLRCEELCLKERQFVCRSGEYDYALQQCRLSSEDRRSQPKAFRTVQQSNVDYFENQCAPLSDHQMSADCHFRRHEHSDLRRADLVRPAPNQDMCRQLCDGTRAFLCRSFTYHPQKQLCLLSSDDSLIQHALDTQSGVEYYERAPCLDLQLFCNSDSMSVQLNSLEPFSGKLYAKEEPIACEAVGRNHLQTMLTLPFAREDCGVRQENGRYSSVVVIQSHPLIQRKGDRVVQVTCHFETVNKTITNSFSVIQDSPQTETALVNASAPSPNIRLRITDKDGNDVTGAKLGQELYLRVELDDESVFGILARDLLAKSGKTDETIQLIDERGCPVDRTIFPELERVSRDPNKSKALFGRFDAFKFSDDNVVRFQVNVQFCLEQCLPTDCADNSTQSGGKSYGRRRRRETPSSGLLPDYPLQREIIVEATASGAEGGAAYRQEPVRKERDSEDMSLFCTSRTTLMAALLTIITLQLTIIASCCACAMIYKRSDVMCCASGALTGAKGDEESVTTSSSTRDILYGQTRVSSGHTLFSQMTRMD